jgi:penicillin-binding protein 1C
MPPSLQRNTFFGRCRVRAALWVLIATVACWFLGQVALLWVPLPRALFARPAPAIEFVDREGRPLRLARSDSNPYSAWAEYHEIPRPLLEATVAAEDRRFWRHSGVDWLATVRAGGQFLLHGRVVSGASTISQQLIKLAQPRPRTVRTKILEALQAMRLEQLWTKQQILAAYLNRLEYGNLNCGCVSAAQFYFAKPLRDLSPAECALLAGLPQAPSRLNPVSHFDRALKRQRWVLSQMRRSDALNAAAYERALNEPLRLAGTKRAFEAPHFVDLLLAAGDLPPGKPVATTLDLPLNRYAQESLRARLLRLREQHVSNGAVVVIENRTGDVLALVGSDNYFAPGDGQVNGAWAPRSPGSALKPFTYWLALERGATPATVVADVPTDFSTATGIFSPANYDHRCYGPTRYRDALANSLNISAVKVLASIGGPQPLQGRLQQCGLSTLTNTAEHYGLGLTIGNAEVRLLELANAYATLARLGEYRPYRLALDAPLKPALRVGDRANAYLIADILADNDARARAFGPDSPLRFAFPVACKTGTSSDFRDNWAFGYTPEYTVGVWVGNFDGAPMERVSGVTGAGPLLHDLFEYLHEHRGTSWYTQPADIVEAYVNRVTGKGLLPTADGTASVPLKEKFASPNLPGFESRADYAGASGKFLLGPEYREWLAGQDNWLGKRALAESNAGDLRIVFPLPGTTLYLDADLPGGGANLPLRASRDGALRWQSDTLEFEAAQGREVARLTEGKHTIRVVDPASGERAETWITVFSR